MTIEDSEKGYLTRSDLLKRPIIKKLHKLRTLVRQHFFWCFMIKICRLKHVQSTLHFHPHKVAQSSLSTSFEVGLLKIVYQKRLDGEVGLVTYLV